MSEALEAYLCKQGARIVALEWLVGLLVGVLAQQNPALVEANIRFVRIARQQISAADGDCAALDNLLRVLEENVQIKAGHLPGPFGIPGQ